jgi:hypothetical protein
MQAAHDAAQIPLPVADTLHRIVSVFHAGIVKGVDIKAADYDDPEHPVGDRAQIIKRIQCRSKNPIEPAFQTQENALAGAMDEFNHDEFVAKQLCEKINREQQKVASA